MLIGFSSGYVALYDCARATALLKKPAKLESGNVLAAAFVPGMPSLAVISTSQELLLMQIKAKTISTKKVLEQFSSSKSRTNSKKNRSLAAIKISIT